MGACAGCMGPSRRDQNYRVNRLTQNSPIKSRVSSQLPVYKHQSKIVEQLNYQKRRIDKNSLINLLTTSPQVSSSYIKQSKLSPQKYRQAPTQIPFFKQNYQNHSLILPRSIRRTQSSVLYDNSAGMNNSFHFSNEKTGPVENRTFVSEIRVGNISRQMSKVVLSQVGSNKNANDVSLQLKKKSLLGIPQIPEEQSRTPLYMNSEKKNNGEDVLRTGLVGIPSQLETAPSANLFRYLKDLIRFS